jgi:hypothetical protein
MKKYDVYFKNPENKTIGFTERVETTTIENAILLAKVERIKKMLDHSDCIVFEIPEEKKNGKS